MQVFLRQEDKTEPVGVYIPGDLTRFDGTVEFRDARGGKEFNHRIAAQITEEGQRLIRELVAELERQGIELFK